MVDVKAHRTIRAAILAGKTEDAIALVEANPEHLHMDTPFGSWLHVAATAGNVQLVQRLIALGIDINRRGGTFNGAAINVAASYGQIEVVRFLLANGAELDTSDSVRNPLFSAIYGGHAEIVELLLSHGIDHSVRYTGDVMNGTSALDFAIERGQRNIAAILQRASARKGSNEA